MQHDWILGWIEGRTGGFLGEPHSEAYGRGFWCGRRGYENSGAVPVDRKGKPLSAKMLREHGAWHLEQEQYKQAQGAQSYAF